MEGHTRARFVLPIALAATFLAAYPSPGGAGTSPPTCHGRLATVVGTPHHDRYTSTHPNPEHRVHSGDVFVLRRGHDSVVAGDTLSGSSVRNITVCGGRGRDRVNVFEPFEGRGLFDGGAGRDRLGNADDPEFQPDARLHLFGGSGADLLKGDGRRDKIKSGPGDDLVIGFEGDDRIFGGHGRDEIYGSGQSDELFGGRGDDFVKGGNPSYLFYQDGRDLADGGADQDECHAEVTRRCEF